MKEIPVRSVKEHLKQGFNIAAVRKKTFHSKTLQERLFIRHDSTELIWFLQFFGGLHGGGWVGGCICMKSGT